MARVDGKNNARRAVETFAGLREALERLEGLLNHQAESFGLTMNELRILEALREGPRSHIQLGKKLVCSTPNISRVVKNLKSRGLVASRLDKAAGRINVARLTAEGAKVIAEVLPHHLKLVHAQMSAISPREQRTLRRICEKLSLGNPMRLVKVLTRQGDQEDKESRHRRNSENRLQGLELQPRLKSNHARRTVST